MKNFLRIIGLIILSLFFMYVGAILGSFGAMYFMLCKTKADWIELIKNIPDENMWVFVSMMLFSGIMNFLFAMYLFTTIYKPKPPVKKPIEGVTQTP